MSETKRRKAKPVRQSLAERFSAAAENPNDATRKALEAMAAGQKSIHTK